MASRCIDQVVVASRVFGLLVMRCGWMSINGCLMLHLLQALQRMLYIVHGDGSASECPRAFNHGQRNLHGAGLLENYQKGGEKFSEREYCLKEGIFLV